MAEIFVVTADADFAGQYVSDLPVINEAPASRQVGFYLPSLASAYQTELASYLTSSAANLGGETAAVRAGEIIALVGGAITEGEINTAWGAGGVLAGTATIEEILRILTGADSAFAETGVVGNGRLIGGKRRIYLRDRTTASLGEGFLRVHSDAGNLVVYLADGSIAS
jgi:hypothetical protein